MKKLMTHASIRFVLGFWFIVSLFVFGNTPVVKADETPTLEGEWVVQSSWDSGDVGSKYAIVRAGDGYKKVFLGSAHKAASTPGVSEKIFYGSPSQITATETLSYEKLLALYTVTDDTFRSVLQELGGKLTQNQRLTLSPDGLFAEFAEDNIHITCDSQTGRLTNYNMEPFSHKATWMRVASAKVESRADHAYAADCGPIVPNRTVPITTDLCPGNLVAMTYFCGGDTGCPYVCCPKGLPYLNHCDCKCYATADFDCHSYSKAQEQPKQ